MEIYFLSSVMYIEKDLQGETYLSDWQNKLHPEILVIRFPDYVIERLSCKRRIKKEKIWLIPPSTGSDELFIFSHFFKWFFYFLGTYLGCLSILTMLLMSFCVQFDVGTLKFVTAPFDTIEAL